ncbi:MAG: type IV pilus assembly protein PilM [bacterium]|nr:type IV pilus assembly protein PilM [bacterium]
MSLFSSTNTNNSMVGIDLGIATIKVVELKNENNKPTLVTFGITTDESTTSRLDKDTVIKNLVDLLAQARTTTDRVVGALPATSIFSTIVELPHMSDKEVNSAIQWEVKKLVPLPIEKMSLNWHILPSQEPASKDGPKKVKIIINAAPKDTTKQYVDIFKKSNLRLISLETEIKALQRALLTPTEKTSLIIDIGATNTSLMVFDNNLPLLTKNVEIGGSTLTNNIATTLNINFDSADQTKINMGLTASGGMDHPAVKSMKFAIDNILIREIRYLSTILRSSNNKNIEKIILSGGSAQLKNLPQYLEKELQIKTTLGNPWQKIKYPAELKDELDKIGPKMSVAVGLALKIFEK